MRKLMLELYSWAIQKTFWPLGAGTGHIQSGSHRHSLHERSALMQSHACQFNVGLTVTSQCLFCWFCCTPRVFSGSTNQNETGHIPKAPLFAASSGLYCHELVGGATYYWIALDSSLFYLRLSFPYLITFSQSTAYFIAFTRNFFPNFTLFLSFHWESI